MSRQHRVLVASMPKSGSTYLTTVISNLPRFRVTSWVPDYGRREQELCSQRLKSDQVTYPDYSLVAQQHVRYSEVTRRYMEEFDLKPLVLVRNLYDVVPSLIDHHHNESVVYPMGYVPPQIVDWDWERAAMCVTDMVLPWYFNFYASWNECDSKQLLSYEELVADPEKTIARVCSGWSIKASDRDIREAVQQAGAMPTRKNIGTGGRGSLLPESCKKHIQRMASHFEDMDLSRIGIERGKA